MSKGDLGEMINQFKVKKQQTGEIISGEEARQMTEETSKTLDKSNLQLDADLGMENSFQIEEGKSLDKEEAEIESEATQHADDFKTSDETEKLLAEAQNALSGSDEKKPEVKKVEAPKKVVPVKKVQPVVAQAQPEEPVEEPKQAEVTPPTPPKPSPFALRLPQHQQPEPVKPKKVEIMNSKQTEELVNTAVSLPPQPETQPIVKKKVETAKQVEVKAVEQSACP